MSPTRLKHAAAQSLRWTPTEGAEPRNRGKENGNCSPDRTRAAVRHRLDSAGPAQRGGAARMSVSRPTRGTRHRTESPKALSLADIAERLEARIRALSIRVTELGYGLALERNRGVLTPYIGLTFGEGGSRTKRGGVPAPANGGHDRQSLSWARAPPNAARILPIVTVRVPGDGIHAAATGVTQFRGKARPSDRSAHSVAALIPRAPNGYCRSVPPHVRGRAQSLTSIRFRYAYGKLQARSGYFCRTAS